MHAVSPTTLPAEISVPESTMHPPTPSAIGSFAAVSETTFIIEESERNAGTRTAIKITAAAIIIYIALFSRSV